MNPASRRTYVGMLRRFINSRSVALRMGMLPEHTPLMEHVHMIVISDLPSPEKGRRKQDLVSWAAVQVVQQDR